MRLLPLDLTGQYRRCLPRLLDHMCYLFSSAASSGTAALSRRQLTGSPFSPCGIRCSTTRSGRELLSRPPNGHHGTRTLHAADASRFERSEAPDSRDSAARKAQAEASNRSCFTPGALPPDPRPRFARDLARNGVGSQVKQRRRIKCLDAPRALSECWHACPSIPLKNAPAPQRYSAVPACRAVSPATDKSSTIVDRDQQKSSSSEFSGLARLAWPHCTSSKGDAVTLDVYRWLSFDARERKFKSSDSAKES